MIKAARISRITGCKEKWSLLDFSIEEFFQETQSIAVSHSLINIYNQQPNLRQGRKSENKTVQNVSIVVIKDVTNGFDFLNIIFPTEICSLILSSRTWINNSWLLMESLPLSTSFINWGEMSLKFMIWQFLIHSWIFCLEKIFKSFWSASKNITSCGLGLLT